MVNVIISRKGFDSAAGGCASPILPDGKNMVTLPIPDHIFKEKQYYDLRDQKTGKTYHQIIEELRPRCSVGLESCHLDPDINPILHPENDWVPVFGQESTAESILENNGVGVGDIFIYFGWYRGCVENEGRIRYACKRDGLDFFHTSDIHAVFGYLEVKEIVREPEEMENRFSWHPHVVRNNHRNAMYVSDKNSSGVFTFDKKRVLTKYGRSRSKWDLEKLLWMKEESDSMNLNPVFDKDIVTFRGRWQELVIRDAGEECLDWVREITSN